MSPNVVEFSTASTLVRQEALSWPDRARAVVIADHGTYAAACDLLKGIKGLRGRIAETFDPHIQRAFQAHRALCREKADAEAPLTEAESILKRAIVAYDEEQERRRQAEEARLREAARQAEETRRLEEAAALEREGFADEAAAVFDSPSPVSSVILEKSTPKVQGIAFRETWSAKVTSLQKLIAYVAAHPEHANLLAPNLPALNALARSLKNGMRIDGVDAVCTRSAAASAR